MEKDKQEEIFYTIDRGYQMLGALGQSLNSAEIVDLPGAGDVALAVVDSACDLIGEGLKMLDPDKPTVPHGTPHPTSQDNSESRENQVNQTETDPDHRPVEASPVVRFMEHVDFRDINNWIFYLEKQGHDVTRGHFSQIVRDAYGPEENPQAQG